jgi:hypothetical protein
MFKLLTCMAFILTHSVAAQAAGFSGNIRLETKKWITSYVGETEVDGLPVVVNFDEAQIDLAIPEMLVKPQIVKVDLGFDSYESFNQDSDTSFFAPVAPPSKRSYRLNFIVSHNPRIQSTYDVHPRTVSMDGFPRLAYVSSLDTEKLFHFVVTTRGDGKLLVSYTRKTPENGLVTGEIVLSPSAHALRK